MARFPWARSHFVFGDERFVPHDDKDSNARMVDEAMLAHVPVPLDHVHRVPTQGISPDEAAEVYERVLKELYGADQLKPGKPLLDLCLLGLGEDGHTASLIPGETVLDERRRWVAAVGHGRPEVRITLTYPALESSAATVFLVQGEGKRAILDRILAGDDTLPAGRLRPQGRSVLACRQGGGGEMGGRFHGRMMRSGGRERAPHDIRLAPDNQEISACRPLGAAARLLPVPQRRERDAEGRGERVLGQFQSLAQRPHIDLGRDMHAIGGWIGLATRDGARLPSATRMRRFPRKSSHHHLLSFSQLLRTGETPKRPDSHRRSHRRSSNP